MQCTVCDRMIKIKQACIFHDYSSVCALWHTYLLKEGVRAGFNLDLIFKNSNLILFREVIKGKNHLENKKSAAGSVFPAFGGLLFKQVKILTKCLLF